MDAHDKTKRVVCLAAVGSLVLLFAAACTKRHGTWTQVELNDLGTRYAAAWSSQDPQKFAALYTRKGSLSVNEGPPAVGREAVAAKAKAFMDAFPDMVVKMDSMERTGDVIRFHWTWTGTNTGPGGNGRHVKISGYEDWTLGPAGRIRESRGHYDEAEFQRQMGGDAGN